MTTPANPPADLVAWLRQQLDDDAQTFAALDSTALNGIDSTAGWDVREYVERGLADVDAKREILAKYEGAMAQEPKRPDDQVNRGYILGMNAAVIALALPYADREGYRDEWRP